MSILILSFLAGVLTVAAPCVLPLLPVIIGGSLVDGPSDKARTWVRPLIIAASLAVSVVVFSLLLKATTALLGISPQVWQIVSGAIVLLLGINFVQPRLWDALTSRLNLLGKSNIRLGKSMQHRGQGGAVLIGASLGPIFSSCSPTYALIVATILPVSFAEGFVYLVAYAAGLAAALLMIAYSGQLVVERLKWLANPYGAFRRTVGVLFILVGIAVIFGLDKDAQTFVLERGWYDPIGNLEKSLMP